MKLINWRKNLAATLAACGMLSPTALRAAELNTNLIVNPGFENVDLAMPSVYYGAPLILDWSYLGVPGYAYSHDPDTTAVAGFANGGALTGGGLWYFTPGNSGIHSFEQALFQDLDLSTGGAAAAIAGGGATFDLSAFFSTYGTQADRAFVQVDFYDSTQSAVLSSTVLSTPAGSPLTAWTEFSTSGAVPAGAVLAQVSIWGQQFDGATGSADGYMDNLDFRIQGSVAGPNADFDSVGGVDGADLVIWQRNLGATTGATRAMGNANPAADGDVDADDLATWVAQFGTPGGAAASIGVVPEPGALSLTAAAAAALAAARRRRD